ncbi:hypothetical protein ACGFZB_28555 [Streptomyces cinerochromogenes]|uniref:Head-to-tail stopper n=1 Tax=Streptomyces cinerochromogenes TaxID=66422 RepID=A0ABW7BF22_9ACTN
MVMSETLIIERPGTVTRDSTGSKVPGPPVQITVTNCGIYSPYGVTVGSSSETHDASSTVETRRVFGAPLFTDVRPGDRILRGDERWEVVGEPMEFRFTSLARVEATVKRVTG